MTAQTNWTANDARSLSGGLNTLGVDSNSTLDGTGWRNVLTLIESGASASAAKLVRRGFEVKVRGLAAAPNGSLRWLSNLPVGFRPEANTSVRVLGADLIIGSGGFINFLANTPTSASTWFEFTYEVTGAFPTSGLPGTAV